MTRGLYPPDTLTKDDIQTLGNVRRDIWANGLMGGGLGMCTGLVFHTGAHWAHRKGWTSFRPNRNTAMLSVLGTGALGMFLLATQTGKQEVHQLHDIFQIGAVHENPNDNPLSEKKLTYPQTRLASISSKAEELEAKRRQEVRMVRRSSLLNRMQTGQGLSDSHGGHWVHDEDVDPKRFEQVRTVRRQSLKDSFEKGHGFSDSHGGHWYKDEDVDPKRLEQVRMARRQSMQANLRHGHGFSDAHGGRWVAQEGGKQ